MWCCTKTGESYREIVIRTVEVTTYRLRLSTLHARITVSECLLDISYRLEIKRRPVRGEEGLRKLKDLFKNEKALLVNKVKAAGSGTSKDGNTARKFF